MNVAQGIGGSTAEQAGLLPLRGTFHPGYVPASQLTEGSMVSYTHSRNQTQKNSKIISQTITFQELKMKLLDNREMIGRCGLCCVSLQCVTPLVMSFYYFIIIPPFLVPALLHPFDLICGYISHMTAPFQSFSRF